ncbi:MAG: HEAT repeat domain-containing protein [Planctomycetales bacterium]
MAVISALQELKDERAVFPLIELFGQDEIFSEYEKTPRKQMSPVKVKEFDDWVRKAICDAFVELGDKRAIAALQVRKELNEPWVLVALGNLGDMGSISELLTQLKSDPYDSRQAAAEALQQVPDSRSIDALSLALNRASRHGDSGRRLAREIAKALAATGDSRAAEVLIASTRQSEFWRKGKHFRSRYYGDAIFSFVSGRADDDPVIWPLYDMGALAISTLMNELTLPDHPANQSPETATTQQYSSWWSREVAACALSRINVGSYATRDDLPMITATMMSLLKRDSEPFLQQHVARTLLLLDVRAAIPEMIRILNRAAETSASLTDADIEKQKPNVRARFPDRRSFWPNEAENQLLEAAELATCMADVLIQLGANTPETHQAMERLLSQRVTEIRELAIRGIVRTGHPRSTELITPLLADPMDDVRSTAAWQLGYAGDRTAVPKLVELINAVLTSEAPKPILENDGFHVQRDPRIRMFQAAARALGMLSAPPDTKSPGSNSAAGDAVFALRAIDDDRLQAYVIMSLVQMQDPRGVNELRSVMSGDNAGLRKQVMSQAASMTDDVEYGWGPGISNPAVRAILRDHAENDSNARVRSSGVVALRSFSDEDSIKTFVAMCDDENDHVRKCALGSLLSTTHSGRFEMLKRFLSDESSDCRWKAIEYYTELHIPHADFGGKPVADSELPDGAPAVAESIDIVASMLSDDVEQVRVSALKSLGRLIPLAADPQTDHIEMIKRISIDDDAAKVRNRARSVLLHLNEQVL